MQRAGSRTCSSYDEFKLPYIPYACVESDAASVARNYLWGQCLVLGIASIVLVGLVFFTPTGDAIRFALLVFMAALCLVGFGASLAQLFRAAHPIPPPSGEGAFACRHCGRRFPTRRLQDGHERVCPEMKL